MVTLPLLFRIQSPERKSVTLSLNCSQDPAPSWLFSWLPPPSRSMSSITLTPTPASHLATFIASSHTTTRVVFTHRPAHKPRLEQSPKPLSQPTRASSDMAVYHCVLSAAQHSSQQIFTRWSTGYLRALHLLLLCQKCFSFSLAS